MMILEPSIVRYFSTRLTISSQIFVNKVIDMTKMFGIMASNIDFIRSLVPSSVLTKPVHLTHPYVTSTTMPLNLPLLHVI